MTEVLSYRIPGREKRELLGGFNYFGFGDVW